MDRKLVRRTWMIRLAVVGLSVSCLAYSGARALNFKARVAQPVDPNVISPQSTSRDGVVILFSSLPGIAREQTLSMKFFNPRGRGESEGQPLPVQVRLLDEAGNAVSETRQITVPPGGFASINFKRTDVALPGDSLTGRVETTAEFRTRPLWAVRAQPGLLLQVFDDLTGKTTVAMEPAIVDRDPLR
jgi:hypothetical protein